MIESLVAFVSRLSGRGKIMLYGALIVVSLVLLALLAQEIRDEMSSLDEEIGDMETSIRKARAVISQEERLTERARIYARYFKEIGSDDKEILSLQNHIGELASKSSVVARDIKPVPGPAAAEEERPKRYRVNLTCEAKMEKLVGFFHDIENSESLLRIENFHIVLKKEGSKIITCTMDVSRYVLY